MSWGVVSRHRKWSGELGRLGERACREQPCDAASGQALRSEAALSPGMPSSSATDAAIASSNLNSSPPPRLLLSRPRGLSIDTRHTSPYHGTATIPRAPMVSRPNTALGQIHTQIMWSRLIAVVEEQAQTMIRTAFSTSVREAGDLSAGVFDREGRMLAQAVTGTPGHVNSMANAVTHFLKVYPLEKMKPGDHYITNDPWLTSGHLHDITVVTPSFYKGKPIGLFACTVHVVDIGGLGMGPDGRQVFEEGLSIPIMPLAREGKMNEDLLQMVRANVREPLQVEGDIYALCACNEEGSKRLIEMMDEFKIADLDNLGETIVEASREATLAKIRALPKGTFRNSVQMDGYDKPLCSMPRSPSRTRAFTSISTAPRQPPPSASTSSTTIRSPTPPSA